ncbi:secretoglobin family 1D member [Equus caballus]|uniref:Secretoglobin family 1A member 1 n=1 Tax=Equus caballus TaxID=9796 RepID=A0A3Q2HLK8_HORSE|nr:secretoglobin family 1D member [Equus caballus]XP_008509951.1 PREDICTED: secretoglobin family 1D member-like [Equus przewalskii]
MRLFLPVLLVTLALCCCETNAATCPAVATDIASFFLLPDSLFKLQLIKYQAPPEAKDATMQVKQCINEISAGDRYIITETLGKIVLQCGA